MTIDWGLGPVALTLLGAAIVIAFVVASGIFRYIPNNRIAVVEKLWSSKGSIQSGLIALKLLRKSGQDLDDIKRLEGKR